MNKTLSVIALASILSGCGGGFFDQSCDDQRADLVKSKGNPDRITKYDSGDYHQWSYWYGSYARTFTWGGAAGSCSTSDYTG